MIQGMEAGFFSRANPMRLPWRASPEDFGFLLIQASDLSVSNQPSF
jgi:hypothetical protein